jgi:hypothetical protein
MLIIRLNYISVKNMGVTRPKILYWNLSRKGRMQFAPTGFWLKSKRWWSLKSNMPKMSYPILEILKILIQNPTASSPRLKHTPSNSNEIQHQ